MVPVIKRIVKDIEFGERPHKDIQTQSLHFVDYLTKRYETATKLHFKARLGLMRTDIVEVVPTSPDKNEQKKTNFWELVPIYIMEPVIEKIVEDVFFGKSLFWDIYTQSLYFVDYVSRTINRYVPGTHTHFKASLESPSSFLIPVEDRGNKFVISNRTQIAIVSWDGLHGTVDAISKLVDIDEFKNCNMLRTGKCDEWGRLWTGLMIMENYNPRRNIGTLYSYRVGTIKKYFECEVVSGIAWNMSNSKMFYINSNKKRVDAFDFDVLNGDIKNRQVLFSFDKHELDGMPYGMTSDDDDNLWIAIISAGKVIQISSKKPETLLYTLNIPIEQPVSLAWGGENLDELYISTSSFPRPSITMTRLLDGSLYKVTGLKAKGIPMHTFSLVCLP